MYYVDILGKDMFILDKEFNIVVGQKLRECRESRKISRPKLAKELGIEVYRIVNYESGKMNGPDRGAAYNAIKYFGLEKMLIEDALKYRVLKQGKSVCKDDITKDIKNTNDYIEQYKRNIENLLNRVNTLEKYLGVLESL